MQYLSIIAIFCAPIYGTLFTKDNINWKDLILKYLRHLVLSNVITNFILYTFTESLELTFTSLFFVKYTSLDQVNASTSGIGAINDYLPSKV